MPDPIVQFWPGPMVVEDEPMHAVYDHSTDELLVDQDKPIREQLAYAFRAGRRVGWRLGWNARAQREEA